MKSGWQDLADYARELHKKNIKCQMHDIPLPWSEIRARIEEFNASQARLEKELHGKNGYCNLCKQVFLITFTS